MATRPAKPISTTRGKNTDVCVALVPQGSTVFPVSEVLTVGATPAAKGATTLTVASATTNSLVSGQGLVFVDSNDAQYLAVLDADYEPGVTELTVRALGEEIPAASTAAFPVRFALRTTADVSKSLENEETDTFDHEATSYTPTTANAEMTLDGMFGWVDAGRETLEAAYASKGFIYVSKTLDAPSAAYVRGEREEGIAIVSSLDKPAPNDGQVNFNASLQISGQLVRTDPVPTS